MKTEKKLNGLEKDQLDLSSIKGGRANIKNALLNEDSKIPTIGSNVKKGLSIETASDVRRGERISADGEYPPKK